MCARLAYVRYLRLTLRLSSRWVVIGRRLAMPVGLRRLIGRQLQVHVVQVPCESNITAGSETLVHVAKDCDVQVTRGPVQRSWSVRLQCSALSYTRSRRSNVLLVHVGIYMYLIYVGCFLCRCC